MTAPDLFRAVMIAEGAEKAKDHEEYLAAWQLLVDSGVVWTLQGSFGRQARDMLLTGELRWPVQWAEAEAST